MAAIILLTFAVFAAPAPGTTERPGTTINQETRHILSVLDTAGGLRPAAVRQDVQQIHAWVADEVAGRPVGIVLTVVNTTSNRTAVTDRQTVQFSVNTSRARRQILRVWYRDATALNTTVNGDHVANHTGVVSGYEEFDLSTETGHGTNKVTFTGAGSSIIGYSIEIYNRVQYQPPPADTNVYTGSRFFSGSNASIMPVEVTAVSWQ